jgi:hypothetical protein
VNLARVSGRAESGARPESSLGVLDAGDGPLPYSGDVSDSGPITQHRAERVLAFMFVGIIGISILAFIAVMIGTLAGAGEDDGFSQGVWPIVLTLPLFGLPIAFLLLIALLIVNGVRRTRASRAGSS